MTLADAMSILVIVLIAGVILFMLFFMGYFVWICIDSERNIRRMRKRHEEMEMRIEQRIKQG